MTTPLTHFLPSKPSMLPTSTCTKLPGWKVCRNRRSSSSFFVRSFFAVTLDSLAARILSSSAFLADSRAWYFSSRSASSLSCSAFFASFRACLSASFLRLSSAFASFRACLSASLAIAFSDFGLGFVPGLRAAVFHQGIVVASLEGLGGAGTSGPCAVGAFGLRGAVFHQGIMAHTLTS